MDERRDPPPERESGPPGLIASGARLSPVQQLQRKRAAHAEVCQRCSDVDRERCPIGEELWRDWTKALDDAYRQLHRGRP